MTEKEGKKILLVEDDQFVLKAYKAAFEKTGYQVDYIEHGSEVLDYLKHNNVNIVMLDLMMPDKNGFEVLTEIKNDSDMIKPPVIVMSNLGQDSDKQKVKELGAVDYIVKADHSMKEILEIIEKYIK
jgi:two-component system alkaline phosphatase synthesis response regulator PhoP